MSVELLNRVHLDTTLDILLCLLIIRNMSILYFFILSSSKPYLVDLYLLLHMWELFQWH